MISLTEEQRMLLDSLEALVENEFDDKAFDWQGETPWENIELLADRGYLGVNIGMEYGGGGMSELAAILTIETVGTVCPDTAQFLYEQQMVAPRAIEMFGTEAAKEKYLPPITAGEDSVAIAISEPEAGSDVAAMNTTCEEQGSDLVVDGEKTWVSSVEESSAAVVWVKFPDEGLGTVIVDLDTPGIEIGEHFTNMAGYTQTQFYLNEVRIPKENVLARGEDAFVDQLKALNWERLGSAALGNAIARAALERAVEYSQDRSQFDQPIGDFQGIEWKIADMTKKLQASRALTYQAAETAAGQGRIPDRLQTSIAKLYSAEIAEEVVSESLQLFGANGYQQGHPLEYLYRMVRGRRIAAGTDEIQKNSIVSVVKENGLPSLT
jgi:alkylation response protein AidB-like acyl-CoA dehydrogenase